MNILQRILKTDQKEAHPTVEELKTSIQKMEQDLQGLQAELKKSQALTTEEEEPGQEAMPTKAETERNIQALKDTISELEVQLRVLRSRVMVSSTTNTIKKQMAQLGTKGSVTLLEKLKEKEVSGNELRPTFGDKTSISPELGQEPGQPLNACSTQAFTSKANALQDTPGLTSNSSDSTTEQP